MNKPQIRQSAKRFLRKVGYDVNKYVAEDYSHRPAERRLQLLQHFNINLVFDIGANTGQYASELRKMGYSGKIISFEPLSSAYKQLRALAKDDTLWETTQSALGDFDGATEINIAANSQSSSILEMLPAHIQAAPNASYIGKEEIVISRLDTILEAFMEETENLFIKIDAQGYEKKILDGAEGIIDKVKGVQVEASLVALYQGEYLIDEMILFMKNLGFTLMSIEPGFSSKETGQLLQADLIFFRQ